MACGVMFPIVVICLFCAIPNVYGLDDTTLFGCSWVCRKKSGNLAG